MVRKLARLDAARGPRHDERERVRLDRQDAKRVRPGRIEQGPRRKPWPGRRYVENSDNTVVDQQLIAPCELAHRSVEVRAVVRPLIACEYGRLELAARTSGIDDRG